MGCGDIASGRSTRCKPAGPGVRLPPQNHRDTSGSTGRRSGVAAVLPAQLRAQGSPQTHGASCSTRSPACLRPTPGRGARRLAGAWTARAGARPGGAPGGGSVDGTCRCPGRWSPGWRGRGQRGQAEHGAFQRRASPRPARSRRIWSPISREVCFGEPCTAVEAMHAIRNQLRFAGGVRPHPRRLCTLPRAAAPHKRGPCSCLRPRSAAVPALSSPRSASLRKPSTCSGTTQTQQRQALHPRGTDAALPRGLFLQVSAVAPWPPSRP